MKLHIFLRTEGVYVYAFVMLMCHKKISNTESEIPCHFLSAVMYVCELQCVQ
jgi:hypothetical protein